MHRAWPPGTYYIYAAADAGFERQTLPLPSLTNANRAVYAAAGAGSDLKMKCTFKPSKPTVYPPSVIDTCRKSKHKITRIGD